MREDKTERKNKRKNKRMKEKEKERNEKEGRKNQVKYNCLSLDTIDSRLVKDCCFDRIKYFPRRMSVP